MDEGIPQRLDGSLKAISVALEAKMRVSVTEIGEWLRCRLAWHYRYQERLRRKDEALYLVVGRVLHEAVQAGAGRGIEEAAKAATLLINAFVPEEDREEVASKIAILLRGVPSDVWVTPLISEDTLEVDYSYGNKAFTLVGKPDAWHLSVDGALVIEEFKTTSRGERDRLLSYEVYNPQMHLYAVILHDWMEVRGYPCPDIYTRICVLSTRGQHAIGRLSLVTKAAIRLWRDWVLDVMEEMVNAKPIPHYGQHCEWCPYNEICTTRLTGGDETSAKQLYAKEE